MLTDEGLTLSSFECILGGTFKTLQQAKSISVCEWIY